MSIAARRALLLGLIAVFLGQTWCVYTDPTGRRTPPLSPTAHEGWRLWHAHNCQSCHQLYGFGGFLGPDLTNATGRLTPERLDVILTEGSGAMPPFDLDESARDALARFLEEVDATGVGQARTPAWRSPQEILAASFPEPSGTSDADADTTHAEPTTFTPLARHGARLILEHHCIDCHLPNGASVFGATDMTTLALTHEVPSLARVVAEGVEGTAMPRFTFTERDVEGLHAALAWMAEHAAPIRARFEAAEHGPRLLSTLPWFEYER